LEKGVVRTFIPRLLSPHVQFIVPAKILPRNLYLLAQKIRQPDLPLLVRQFIFQVLNRNLPTPAMDIPVDDLPDIDEKFYADNSARVVSHNDTGKSR
jgi:hypothetical protein